MLSEFYDKTPDLVSEPELQEYFLHRKNVNRWFPKDHAHLLLRHSFFLRQRLGARLAHSLNTARQNEHRLAAVLSVEQSEAFWPTLNLHNDVYLSTVYSCGLRLHEGLYLEVSDIDSQRMMIHVHRGKGAKDRYVPLPQTTLHLLRSYWSTHRQPHLLFPALGRSGTERP